MNEHLQVHNASYTKIYRRLASQVAHFGLNMLAVFLILLQHEEPRKGHWTFSQTPLHWPFGETSIGHVSALVFL